MKNAKSLRGADINSDLILRIGEVDIRLSRIRGRQATKKFDMEKLKNEEERGKLQRNVQERASNLKTTFGNSNEVWSVGGGGRGGGGGSSGISSTIVYFYCYGG